MPNNPSREAFEAHIDDCIASQEGLTQALDQDGFGGYSTPWVESKWQAWQAGAQAERERINAEHASKVPQVEMEKLQSAVKVLRDRSAP